MRITTGQSLRLSFIYIMYEICFFERKKKEKEDIDPKYVVAGLFCLYL